MQLIFFIVKQQNHQLPEQQLKCWITFSLPPHLTAAICSFHDTVYTLRWPPIITNELNNLDKHIINVINQLKKWKKRTVDVILNQIIKINDWVDINIDFLATCLNSLLEHNVIAKKKHDNIVSFSLNENAQTLDLIEILPSRTWRNPRRFTQHIYYRYNDLQQCTLRLFKPTLFTNVT